ncbi:MAG TPA: nucleoside triphosphate pyrophosphatase [Microbacteriaceae bacterium]|nr:nucleoside triphosphate pyrophosphatase [Microbacteriaceae bacterium]
MRLTLASTSPSRLGLLRMAGIEPVVVAPDVDETAVGAGVAEPRALVELLAAAKARAVSEVQRADAGLILGCDSVFELDGRVYGKPHLAEVATERWRAMRGRVGTLHTGHCLIDASTGAHAAAVVSTEVEFADVSDAEIDWYVATGEPLPVAGAFTLEGLAAPFITRIDGDPHSVVGLSLAALRSLARSLGTPWPSLTSRR